MASVFKRKGSNHYHCQYYVTDPVTGDIKQIRKSTGTANKAKAKDYAREQELLDKKVVSAGSDKAAQAKRIIADAVAEIERETFTAPTARKYLSMLLTIATGEEMESYTLESWIAEWLRRKKRNDSSLATMRRYEGHSEAFLSWLGDDRRKKPLESITTQDARKWREHLQDGGRVGKTVLSYTKDIGAIYRAAIREGLVTYNPFSALETLDTSDSLERKPFTGEEVGSLMGAASTEEWRGLILVAAYTGLRLGDGARLKWSSIDLAAKQITLMPSKTKRKKREVRIPIQPDLLNYFLSAPVAQDDPEAFVFPALANTSVQSRDGLSAQFVKIMTTAKVSRGKSSRPEINPEDETKQRVTWERGFHSLRHTFTTWLRSAGVSEEDRMALTGHTTRDSHAKYSHADPVALKDAIAKLPSLANPKPKK